MCELSPTFLSNVCVVSRERGGGARSEANIWRNFVPIRTVVPTFLPYVLAVSRRTSKQTIATSHMLQAYFYTRCSCGVDGEAAHACEQQLKETDSKLLILGSNNCASPLFGVPKQNTQLNSLSTGFVILPQSKKLCTEARSMSAHPHMPVPWFIEKHVSVLVILCCVCLCISRRVFPNMQYVPQCLKNVRRRAK